MSSVCLAGTDRLLIVSLHVNHFDGLLCADSIMMHKATTWSMVCSSCSCHDWCLSLLLLSGKVYGLVVMRGYNVYFSCHILHV